LEEMVEISKSTGDIRANELVPQSVIFRHDAFWTSHFGGTYIFLDKKTTTVICDPKAPGFRKSRPWQVSYLDKSDHRRVYRFLAKSQRIDLPRASWMEDTGFLEHRAEMALRGLVHELEPEKDLQNIDAVWLQTWMHANASAINKDGVYPFLMRMKRELDKRGRIDIDEVDHDFRFQIIRARPKHDDAWLTNRLISEYVTRDFVTRYVFNKQTFYTDYETYDETYRHHVVETLKQTYLRDKAGLRRRLFGLS
ncbi:MAG: DUF6638 family protein, partial [Pseudomonadota bacterium]